MAKKKVVYFLGAGFTAPLGIPTMAQFYERSRQVHDPDGSGPDFAEVFELLAEVDHVRRHYKVKRDNIEELLSILELADLADPRDVPRAEVYTKYLRDVIIHCTPAFKAHSSRWSMVPEGF